MARTAKAPETENEKKIVIVDGETPVTEIMKLNDDPDVILQWDSANFKDMEEHLVRELRWENQRRYFMAWAAKTTRPASQRSLYDELRTLDTLGSSASRRLDVIQKGLQRGEHRCWKRPDELEESLEAGYRQLRSWTDPKVQAEKGYSPEADGEVLKLNSSDGRGVPFVELLGMVIDRQRFENHMKKVSLISVSRYKDLDSNLQEQAEIVNRGLKHRGGYVKLVNEVEQGEEVTRPVIRGTE